MTGALGVEDAKKVMLVRQLGMEEERNQEAGTCRWCGQVDSVRGSHLQHHCPELYLRAVQAFHALLKGLDNHEGWTRVGVAGVEAWYVKGTKRLWVGPVPDGSLGDFVDKQRDGDVVLLILAHS